jgi:hypothetical protein
VSQKSPLPNADPAARQRASRDRKKAQKIIEAQERDRLAQIKKLVEESKKESGGRGRGGGQWFMQDAERGKGKIATGGYDPQQIAKVDSAQIRDGKTRDDLAIEAGGSGHKKRNEGHGPDGAGDEEIEFVSSKVWTKIFDGRKPLRLSRSSIHFFCPRHSLVEVGAPFAFLDPEMGACIRLYPALYDRKNRVWVVGCGCTRPFRESKQRNIVTSGQD